MQIKLALHFTFADGAFVARRARGSHHNVSLDMFLEQTYYADFKEHSGLDGITRNTGVRTKQVYTKPGTSAMYSKLNAMLHMNNSLSPHHEAGKTRVRVDKHMVLQFKSTHLLLKHVSSILQEDN